MTSRSYEIDMTHGSIMPKLFTFFLPLMFSGMLQLLFNAVDIIIVGRYSGSESLAAVGSTTALINMFVNLFIGVSLGSNVLVARYHAMEDQKALSEVVHTAVTLALISGIAMIFVGFIFARPALELMGTPANVIDRSVLYMRIYFCGMPFFMVYNYCAAILRAVGDTKRPLIFLIIAGICNAVLNMILVIIFHLGVAGVAIATVFSLFISSTLVVTVLLRTEGDYRLDPRKLHINKMYMVRILRIGIPAGMQSLIINFSNVLLQSSVNTFGSLAMAGYTATNNLLGFMFVSVDAVAQACMNFTSQNYGVKNTGRMDRTFRDCVLLEIIVGLSLGCFITVFGKNLLHIYTADETAVSFGLEIASITVLPYFLCGLMNLLPATLRGLGHSTIPMILSLIGTVGTRILWIFVFFPMNRSLFFLFISYPLSWIVTLLLQVICYLKVRKKTYSHLLA